MPQKYTPEQIQLMVVAFPPDSQFEIDRARRENLSRLKSLGFGLAVVTVMFTGGYFLGKGAKHLIKGSV